jgi:hypothetical protein
LREHELDRQNHAPRGCPRGAFHVRVRLDLAVPPCRPIVNALPIPPPTGTVHWLPEPAFQFAVTCGPKVRYQSAGKKTSVCLTWEMGLLIAATPPRRLPPSLC